MQDSKKTVAIDFDGVIHKYSSGWKGDDIIPDGMVESSDFSIRLLRRKYNVVIFSCRAKTQSGKDAIKKWLDEHNIQVDDITNIKPHAFIYIDDKGAKFNGNWEEILDLINLYDSNDK